MCTIGNSPTAVFSLAYSGKREGHRKEKLERSPFAEEAIGGLSPGFQIFLIMVGNESKKVPFRPDQKVPIIREVHYDRGAGCRSFISSSGG